MAKQKKDESQALTLFAISNELQQIINSIEESGGECNDETFALLQSWQAELTDKGESIAHVIARKEGKAEYWRRVKAAADAELRAEERGIAGLKKYLRDAMLATGTKSIKRADGLFSIGIQSGRASVHVSDEKKLPYDLVDVVELIKPKTPAIKEALERGEQVPGATLEYGEPFISIRIKSAKGEENNG